MIGNLWAVVDFVGFLVLYLLFGFVLTLYLCCAGGLFSLRMFLIVFD